MDSINRSLFETFSGKTNSTFYRFFYNVRYIALIAAGCHVNLIGILSLRNFILSTSPQELHVDSRLLSPFSFSSDTIDDDWDKRTPSLLSDGW